MKRATILLLLAAGLALAACGHLAQPADGCCQTLGRMGCG